MLMFLKILLDILITTAVDVLQVRRGSVLDQVSEEDGLRGEAEFSYTASQLALRLLRPVMQFVLTQLISKPPL